MVFIHKCTFIDCRDGSLDIVRGSDYITSTWCRYKYPTLSSSTQNFPNLIGNRDNNASVDQGKLHVTMHHNWYDVGCWQRMPRVRYGQVHVYNNYYGCPPKSPTNDYAIGVGIESSILFENSCLEDISNTWWDWTNNGIPGEIEWRNLHLVRTELSTWATNSDVFDPPYTYTMNSSANAKSIVTYSTYGAGNCLDDNNRTTHSIVTLSEHEVKLYPNPATNYVEIKGIEGRANVMIFDIGGKLLINNKLTGNEIIAVDELSKGIYLLRIINSNVIFGDILLIK